MLLWVRNLGRAQQGQLISAPWGELNLGSQMVSYSQYLIFILVYLFFRAPLQPYLESVLQRLQKWHLLKCRFICICQSIGGNKSLCQNWLCDISQSWNNCPVSCVIWYLHELCMAQFTAWTVEAACSGHILVRMHMHGCVPHMHEVLFRMVCFPPFLMFSSYKRN